MVPLRGSKKNRALGLAYQIRQRPVRVLFMSGVFGLCGVRARAECFGDIGLTNERPAVPSSVLGVEMGRLGGRVSSALGLGKSSRRTSMVAGGANRAGAT